MSAFDYKYDARRKDYLYRYTMYPKQGFNINVSISYEKNNLFEGFKANDQFGGFLEDLKSHNTARYKFDISNYWKLKSSLTNDFIIFKNNIKYYQLSNEKVDEFLYFFGGGLLGIKCYNFFEPTLQGTQFTLITNSFTTPIFIEKNYTILIRDDRECC